MKRAAAILLQVAQTMQMQQAGLELAGALLLSAVSDVRTEQVARGKLASAAWGT
jgi:hypothetical protein